MRVPINEYRVDVESPKGFGYERRINEKKEGSDENDDTEKMLAIRKKRAWELAFTQGKSLPINFVMLYMFGNTIQIYSITMILMLIRGAIKSILSMNETSNEQKAFGHLEQAEESELGESAKFNITLTKPSELPEQITEYVKNSPLLPQKLAYFSMNVVCLYLALWKCGKLGLVPTKPSDWLSLLHPKKENIRASIIYIERSDSITVKKKTRYLGSGDPLRDLRNLDYEFVLLWTDGNRGTLLNRD